MAIITVPTDLSFQLDTSTLVGPEGPQGPAGPQGVAGIAGPAGPQGNVGPEGPAGVQGPAGPQGAQGPIGLTGPAGLTGATGPVGATGPQGPIGNTGPVGPAGANGTNGTNGATGPQGPAGPSGSFGSVVTVLASRDLAITDIGNRLHCGSGLTLNLTQAVLDAMTNHASFIEFYATGSALTVTANAGITLRGAGNLNGTRTVVQYGLAALLKVNTTVAVMQGAIS